MTDEKQNKFELDDVIYLLSLVAKKVGAFPEDDGEETKKPSGEEPLETKNSTGEEDGEDREDREGRETGETEKVGEVNSDSKNNEDIEDKSADEDEEDKKSSTSKPNTFKAENNITSLSKMFNYYKNKLEEEQRNKIKAYNSIKNITGDFDFYAMTEREIYNKALDLLNLEANSLEEAKAVIKVFNAVNKIDNSFRYSSPSGENIQEIEINVK